MRDLSTSLNNFGSLKKTTKGGGALKRPAPLCSFFCSQNSSNCCLRSRIFPFQSILACRGSQKVHFVDLGLTWSLTFILYCGVQHWYSSLLCRLRNLVALLISCGIIDLGAFCVELWSFFVSKTISVPMSYSSFGDHCSFKCRHGAAWVDYGSSWPFSRKEHDA